MKNLLTFIFFISALVLFVQLIQAKTADQIIEAYIQAIGGLEKLNLVSSIRMIGTKEILNEQFPVQIRKVQGKFARTDFIQNGNAGYLYITPEIGWTYVPGIHTAPVQIPDEILNYLLPDLDILGPLVNYRTKGNKLELKGKEEINGEVAYKILVTLPSSYQITYFIDRKSKLVVQSHHSSIDINNSSQQTKTIITNFENYQPVNGILFPHTIINLSGHHICEKLSFSSIFLNEDLHQSTFIS